MAKVASVWGIEIGQSALKALKCRLDGETVVAEAFDYIEYPKILSQPDAEPEVMVREALETFISRNDIKRCRIGVSVPGQSGLAKYFKPPPVEMKKIPDIVKYEAKQQIPFDLNDVIWDYQQMAGGSVEDGFALETEVGLFAMKRDAVYRAIKPLQAQGLEIDLIQLAPLSIYNMITFDRLADPEAGEIFDAEHPPKSTVILAMGTDATDLIITNGYRLWQRNMPLGGSHFTRQLTKDLKLTFAKAEHLKRNAMEAEDPKLVFQAMRPVFTDMVNEVQRSVGFFRSLNKKAELSSILLLGNTTKLPGLASYLNKNLGMDVEIMDKFQKLSGDEVLMAPAFKDHQAAFGPVYGLCLQLLGLGPAHTNLVPKEILKQRLIKAKKPWVVAIAAALLLGFVINLLFKHTRTDYVSDSKWAPSLAKADSTKKESDGEKSKHTALLTTVELLTKVGEEVAGNADRRILWMELLNSMFQAMGTKSDPKATPEDLPYYKREDIHISRLDCKYYEDLSTYFNERVQAAYDEDKRVREDRLNLKPPAADGAEPGADPAAAAAPAADATAGDAAAGDGAGVTGPGWVIQLNGWHYHNQPPDTVKDNPVNYIADQDEGEDFLLRRVIHALETGKAKLPIPADPTVPKDFTFKELGISKPFVLTGVSIPNHEIYNIEYVRMFPQQTGAMGGSMDGMGSGGGSGEMMGGSGAMGMGGGMPGGMGMGGNGSEGSDVGGMGMGGMGMGGMAGTPGNTNKVWDPNKKISYPAPMYTFTIQMIWQETPLSKRLEEQAKKAAAEAEEAKQKEENPGAAPDAVAVDTSNR